MRSVVFLAFFPCVFLMAATPPSCSTCKTNEDCAGGEYCARTDGFCAGFGSCEIRPSACPQVWAPVCGCDGNTYDNSCDANNNGVNISHQGECPHKACESGDQCSDDEYCRFEPCKSDVGACTEQPETCPETFAPAPVCGCDGKTYADSCHAAKAGKSVDYEGECKTDDCDDNSSCARSE